jgi:hypothetical protein
MSFMSFMGNLRRFFRRRFYGIIRKQGKLVEMHPYRHTAGFAPAKCLHRPLPPAPLTSVRSIGARSIPAEAFSWGLLAVRSLGASLQSGVYLFCYMPAKVAHKPAYSPTLNISLMPGPGRNFFHAEEPLMMGWQLVLL